MQRTTRPFSSPSPGPGGGKCTVRTSMETSVHCVLELTGEEGHVKAGTAGAQWRVPPPPFLSPIDGILWSPGTASSVRLLIQKPALAHWVLNATLLSTPPLLDCSGVVQDDQLGSALGKAYRHQQQTRSAPSTMQTTLGLTKHD